MTELENEAKVEAGDRALETARKIRQYFLDYYEKPVGDRNFDDGLVVLLDDFVAPIVEEYKSLGFRAGVEAQQSAMNAQERELARTLNNLKCEVVGWLALARPMLIQELSITNVRVMEHHVAEAERLLAERGEPQI